jgi:hypothetical protein
MALTMPAILFTLTMRAFVFLVLVTTCDHVWASSIWDTLGAKETEEPSFTSIVSSLSSFARRSNAAIDDEPSTLAEAAELLTSIRLAANSCPSETCSLVPRDPHDDEQDGETVCHPSSVGRYRRRGRLPNSKQREIDVSAEEVLRALQFECGCPCKALVRGEGPDLVTRCREQRWAEGGTDYLRRLLEQAVENTLHSSVVKLTGKVVLSAGVRVCVPMFYKVMGVRHNMQVQLKKAVLNPSGALSIWSSTVTTGAKDAVIKRSILSWIETYIHMVGDYQPTKDEIHLDPEGKGHIWLKYQASVTTSPWLRASESYFRNIWNWRSHQHPYFAIRAKKDTSSPCADCIQYHLSLRQALEKGTKADVVNAHKYINAHYNRVEANKKLYWKRMEKGKEFDAHLSVVGDIMDQKKTSLPHFKDFRINQALGGYSDVKALFPIKLYGFLVHGDKWLAALAPPWVKKSGSLTVTVLMQALNNVAHLMPFPKVLHWQVDGGSENWNSVVFAWASYLVHKKVFEKIVIHRLHVGHTHCDADQLYSVIRRKLMGFGKTPHGSNGRTPAEWAQAVSSAFVKDGTIPTIQWLNEVFDISKFFDGHMDTTISGYGASIEICEVAPGIIKEDHVRRSHLLVAEVFTPESDADSTPLPMIRFRADDIEDEVNRWYPAEMFNGEMTHADGKKPIGVRFLTSVPRGQPEILKYVPTEWDEFEAFQESLHAIRRRVGYATDEDFICTWETWLSDPPGERIKLAPVLKLSVEAGENEESSRPPVEQSERPRQPEPYGAPVLLYDPITRRGRTNTQKRLLKRGLTDGAHAGAGDDDTFSLEFEELEEGDFVIAYAAHNDPKPLKWTQLLSNGRQSVNLVLARVIKLHVEDEHVTWEYWRKTSKKSDIYIPARHRDNTKIQVTSAFNEDELILTIKPDEGDVTAQGFKLDCVIRQNAVAALEKYSASRRQDVDPSTRTARLPAAPQPRQSQRGSSSQNPQQDDEDDYRPRPAPKRAPNRSPTTPGGSRPARDARAPSTRVKRAINAQK